MVGAHAPKPPAFRVVLDINVLVSHLNAHRAGRSSTISQRAVALVGGGLHGRTPVQLVTSFAMIDAYRNVLLRSGADPFAVEEAAEAWIEMMRFGPDELDPLLILGGTPDLSLKDQEDGGVLAVAFAARANVVVTDNLADFEVGDCETFETSTVRRRDGKTRRLTCQTAREAGWPGPHRRASRGLRALDGDRLRHFARLGPLCLW
jgi:predicted nucleic acid-binding protein